MGVKAQRAAATRTRLVAAARALFAADGYAATGKGPILAAAGVTRGALYHHFADKQALFAAVCASDSAKIPVNIFFFVDQNMTINFDVIPPSCYIKNTTRW